jgi:hypothetical protein
MKPGTIKTGAMPPTARNSAGISENDAANLPNDFGKSRKEKKSWAALVAGAGNAGSTRQATCERWILGGCNAMAC